jgi:hypothetical protein
MPLLKTRPKLKLYLPQRVRPGESFVASVELDAKKAVKVESVTATFEGFEQATIGSGNTASLTRESLVGQVALLAKDIELPAGKTTYRVRFECPTNLPPMHLGRATRVGYEINVVVAIPWWRDREQSFVVPVSWPAAEAERTAVPGVYSSAPEGPTDTEPHAEVSIVDTTVESSGVLLGAVALGNVEYARYLGVDLSLVGYELSKIDGRTQEVELSRHSLHLTTENPSEGQAIEFRMRLPSVVPSFESRLIRVRYLLELRARRRFARDLVLNVPLVILPGTQRDRGSEERKSPPVVGQDRVARLWAKVGEARGFELVDEQLSARVGEVSIIVRREHRGAKGVYLVADASYPSLELGLVGDRMNALRRLLGGSDVLEAPWDSSFGLSARDAKQLSAFAGTLTAACANARFARLDDQKFALELRSSGLSAPPLERFLDLTLRIGRAWPRARAAIPAPEGFELEAWHTLARAVSGSLTLSRMSIRGEIQGLRLEIATEWSGQAPLETRITVHLRSRISPALIGEIRRDSLAKLAERPRALAEVLLSHAETLLVDRDSITALAVAPLPSPERASEWIPELVELGEALAVERAAYR